MMQVLSEIKYSGYSMRVITSGTQKSWHRNTKESPRNMTHQVQVYPSSLLCLSSSPHSLSPPVPSDLSSFPFLPLTRSFFGS